ncbi:MAG: TetR/AcrR family transcriptional regulator [Acidimicrobiia bacterium]
MRTQGRPRSIEADDAILDATMELFCAQGYDALSVEGVAACAGVGKSTIYRRYPAKLDLVMAAIERAKEGLIATPDSGSLREDLLSLARSYLAMLSSRSIGRAIPMMLVAKARSDELADAHTEFVWTRRAATHDVIRKGIERGELPTGTDPAMIADLVFGAIFTRVFVTVQPTDDTYLVAMIDRILAT